MKTPHLIDGSQLKEMFTAGCKWLKVHMGHVNALNVFPVPDGDTGTNMFLTLEAALNKMQPYSGSHAGDVAALASQGALMGARGNSGVILSQILNGLSEGLANKEAFSTSDFAQALQLASNKAYKAVIEPVEGTILTVIKETANRSIQAAVQKRKPVEFLADVLETAEKTLRSTPDLLPILKDAGVVDSGGQGLVYILEGMMRSIKNLPIDIELKLNESPPAETRQRAAIKNALGTTAYGYDVQFLIQGKQGKNLDIDAVREAIVGMGECPLVVGDAETIKVHVHVPDPGVPISYGISQGILLDIVVENMEAQSQEYFEHHETHTTDLPLVTGIICIAPGEGLGQVLESLGAHTVINGGQTMNPSTQEILAAINHLHTNQIVIIPNNSNIILTAQQAGSMTEKDVRVIPSKTIPQGINALLSFNSNSDLDLNDQRMHAALKQVQTIEITQAVRSTIINNVTVKNGDIIGLLDDTLTDTGLDVNQVCLNVLLKTDIEDIEIVTVYYGQDVSQENAEILSSQIKTAHPHLEVETINGGQPHYHYIISLE